MIRDEGINIGVLLEEAPGTRRSARVIEKPQEIARVWRLHPAADEDVLRGLPGDFDRQLRSGNGAQIEKLDQTLSNVLEFSSARAVLAEDFDAELERLYREHVAPLQRGPESWRARAAGSKRRLDSVFASAQSAAPAAAHIGRSVHGAGDAFELDHGYRNGIRGFLHAVAIGRDPVQGKVLAYMAGRARYADCEFTAITETEPALENRRHAFIAQLFENSRISIVPLSRVEKFAEELRVRLQ